MEKKKAVNVANTVKKFEVAKSEKLGRYLIAAKDLSSGEVIIRENAFAVGPAAYETAIFCFACMRPLLPDCKLQAKIRYRCNKCRVAPLCSKACENAIGTHTPRECNLLKEKRDLFKDSIEEVSRVLLHLRICLLKEDDPPAWEQVMRMEAHLDKRKNTPIWYDREMNIINVLRKFEVSQCTSTDPLELQRLCGVIDVNSFELRAPGVQDTNNCALRGLYATAALMAHECRGSACVAVDETFRMTVFAALPIVAGQSVTFNYSSSLLGTIERQEHLKEGKYFVCKCSTCSDPFERGSYLSCIICPKCRRDYVAMQNPYDDEPYGTSTKWQCQRCKKTFSGCLVKTTISITKKIISEADYNSVKALEILLDKMSKTYHTNHFLMLTVKQKILALYRREMSNVNPQRKVLQKMVEMCQEVLDVLEIVEPGVSRLKGIMLYEMHLPIAMLANRAYSAREIGPEQLVKRLEDSQSHLKRALTMLLLEPQDTPEGQLAKRALQEMRLLGRNVEDAKALMKASQENLVKRRGCSGSGKRIKQRTR